MKVLLTLLNFFNKLKFFIKPKILKFKKIKILKLY